MKPFTLIAAIIFGLMALLHVYRLVTHFQVIVGSHTIAQRNQLDRCDRGRRAQLRPVPRGAALRDRHGVNP